MGRETTISVRWTPLKPKINLSAEQWNELGCDAIMELLEKEYAVVFPEIDAKIAEQPYHTSRFGGMVIKGGINPHHLTNARHILVERGVAKEISDTTRGGRSIAVLVPTNNYKRQTNISQAASNKRLLHARYLGWAESSKHGSMIGKAGERVAKQSLRAVAQTGIGYRLLSSGDKDIRTLFGKPILTGPLDDAAQLIVDDNGSTKVLTILIEIKNVRSWFYPTKQELYQLIEKALLLQNANPNELFLPVLICRRSHQWAYDMAKNWGFLFGRSIGQPILPHSEVKEKLLAEVVQGLSYDLISTDVADRLLVSFFSKVIPKVGLAAAMRWQVTCQALPLKIITELRDDTTSWPRRSELVEEANGLLSAFRSANNSFDDDPPF